MERAEQEVVTRRARRVLWAFRLFFYGGAGLVAVLLLTGGADERPAFAEGRTSQGEHFTMRFQDGRPISLGTYVSATCRPTLEWGAKWWSFDGKTAQFRFDDGELRLHESLTREYENGWVGHRDYRLEARVEDDGVRGTMRYDEAIRHPDQPAYFCGSGTVRFAAG